MARVAVAGDTIWLSDITDDQPLLDQLKAMPVGEPIELDIAGTVGGWERIVEPDERGRSRYGIRPIGQMRHVWQHLRSQRQAVVDIHPVAATYLATFGQRMLYWDIPESRVYTSPGDDAPGN